MTSVDRAQVSDEWVCFDPLEVPPPRGELLWVVGPGMVGNKSPWYDGAIAWARLPRVPDSVKKRARTRWTTK